MIGIGVHIYIIYNKGKKTFIIKAKIEDVGLTKDLKSTETRWLLN